MPVIRPHEGLSGDLGIVKMRVILPSADTGGAYSLRDFSGGQGPWTVLHVHNHCEESFYVLEGTFTFTLGDESVEASAGDYVLVPRGTPHMMAAGPEGGRLLTLYVPGGNEEMFIELAKLPPNSIRDPAVRAAIAERYDSVPVQRATRS